MKNKDNFKKQLIYELWQSAAFDDGVYQLIEEITKSSLNKESDKELPLKEIYFELSTIRNRNLVNRQQQLKLRNTTIAFFGMSVGSNAALTWMMLSRADNIKIIDHDTISPTNLNRLRFGWEDIGNKKVDSVAESILKINPFVNITKSSDISEESIRNIFISNPKVDLVVDAIDKIEDKLLLRKLCKLNKIPLVSAADVGDNVFLDIERYDISPLPNYFLGRLPEIESIDFSKLTVLGRKKLLMKLVGFESNSESMLESLNSIGDTISTWPQLGSTATIAGGLITTTIKKILLGELIKSGRYYLDIDKLLVSDFNLIERKNKRRNLISKIDKKFHLNK